MTSKNTLKLLLALAFIVLLTAFMPPVQKVLNKGDAPPGLQAQVITPAVATVPEVERLTINNYEKAAVQRTDSHFIPAQAQGKSYSHYEVLPVKDQTVDLLEGTHLKYPICKASNDYRLTHYNNYDQEKDYVIPNSKVM
ncbi:MAG TPA: hypothetical protein VHO03_16755 [Ignavibacteriales bacterium]|nr:hypothetical protein [Ignavibacteriales bacterium]